MKMKHTFLAIIMVFVLATCWAGLMPPEETMKVLDTKIDKLMQAYNDGDPKVFYADWATTMASICTPQIFQMMFVDGHMKTFGTYKSRKINEVETVVSNDAPNGLLVYEAEFEKNAKAKLAINLFKENETWMIQQVTIQAIP